MSTLRWILVSTLAAATPAPAHAQCSGCCTPEESFPLAGQSPTPDDSDEFGLASDSVGSWLVVGAPGYDGHKGAVFAYVRSGGSWSLDAVLLPPSSAGAARFGSSLAIGRSLVLVGAPSADVAGTGTGDGCAYVFRRDPGGWVLEQALPPNVSGHSSYASDVDLSGTVAIVGAELEEAAYFWRRDPLGCAPDVWCLEDKVTPPPAVSSEYGEAVAVDGDTALVGASEWHLGVNAGAVFHYEHVAGSWVLFEDPLLNPSFSGPGEHYGETVDVNGAWLMVAEPKGGGGGDGIVHAYVRNMDGTFGPGSGYEQILDDGPDGTLFGRSLAMSGRSVMVGAPFTTLGLLNEAGIAYRFGLSSGVWSLADTYVPCGLLGGGDRLGQSVALGDFAVAGAHQDDHSGGTDVGTVYTFTP